MKKIFFLFIGMLFLCNPVLAQFNEKPILNKENQDKKTLNYGFYLGLNQYDFKFNYKNDAADILVQKNFGFNVGILGELRINEFLDLRTTPGLSYTLRNLGFRDFTREQDALREVKSTYINFPLLLKINTRRIGNWRPFLIGGGSASLNLSSNEDSLDDNLTGTFRTKKWTYNYELGFGIDFYLEYFKFTPSIRGIFGLTDELVRDNDPNSPWTGNIESLKTRGLFINFTFE